jgi:hypothetical protein
LAGLSRSKKLEQEETEKTEGSGKKTRNPKQETRNKLERSRVLGLILGYENPHPLPLSPEYRGEGSLSDRLLAQAGSLPHD